MAEYINTNILPVLKKLHPITQQSVKSESTLLQKNNFKEKSSEQEITVESSDSSISDEEEEDYNSSESSESSESSTSSLCLPGPKDDSETSEETDSSDCSDSSDNSKSSSESDIEDLIRRIKSNRTHIEEFTKGILNKNSPDTSNNLPLFNETVVNSLLQNNDTKYSACNQKEKKKKKYKSNRKLVE